MVCLLCTVCSGVCLCQLFSSAWMCCLELVYKCDTSSMLYRTSSDRPGLFCSLHSLAIRFLDVIQMNSVNILQYNVYIR